MKAIRKGSLSLLIAMLRVRMKWPSRANPIKTNRKPHHYNPRRSSPLKSALLAVSLLWTTVETTQAGWIKRYLYYNMSGTAVTNLLNGTNDFGVLVFPDSPDTTELIPTDPSYSPDLAESLSGMGNNYGSYTPGYIEPPETGQYTFWVCGDDETQLWLTTDASDPLNPARPIWQIADFAQPPGVTVNGRRGISRQHCRIYLDEQIARPHAM